MIFQKTLRNEKDTDQFGMELALNLSKLSLNEIEIHLSGDLGAGKTHLARSIISNAGWQGVVKSPTYTLCEEYELDECLFLHIDLYRTLEIEDIDIFNIDRKTHKKKIIIIEWPENLLKKRSYDIKIKFNHLSSGREIEIESNIEQMGKLIDG